jgi:signal transduction histidine kinase
MFRRSQVQPDQAGSEQIVARLRHLLFLLPTLFFVALLFLTIGAQESAFHGTPTALFGFLISTFGVVFFSFSVFALADRVQTKVRDQNRDLARRTNQIRAVYEAGLEITSDLSHSAVLQQVVDSARELVQARCAVLAVMTNGIPTEVITSEAESEDRAVGDLPGCLGVLNEMRPYRSADVTHDPHFQNVPLDKPMTTFLSVPLIAGGKVIGNLYLMDKMNGEFTDEDEEAIETLAVQAAIAIENARLYAQAEEGAVLKERERIGMELHDGAIQALYAVNLKLEDCMDLISSEPARVSGGLDGAIDDVNAVIRDIRSYIFNLHTEQSDDRSLRDSLAELLRNLSVNTLISTELTVVEAEDTDDPSEDLSTDQNRELFEIAHEALENVRKHSQAKTVVAEISREGGVFNLRIVDDGVGFDEAEGPFGEGLRAMRQRADALKGELKVEKGLSGGTAIKVAVPLAIGER